MKFALREHQHKSDRILGALLQKHDRVKAIKKADFFVTEWVWHNEGFDPACIEAQRLGKLVFLYPHSARPGLYDFHEEHFEVAAHFVYSPGHAEVLRRCNYPYPIETIGWPLCDIRPFATSKHHNVLFAPIHPNANGWLNEADKNLNRRTLQTLIDIEVNVRVRHVQSLENNGLEHFKTCEYKQGDPDGCIEDIEWADVIIGAYTFGHMSIALGKPTILIGDYYTPRQGQSIKLTRQALHWENWREYARYPYNFETVMDKPEAAYSLIKHASTVEATDWKERFIGKPFDDEGFINKLEKYL